MIKKYIIPACKKLRLEIDDISEIPELKFNASGILKLKDDREYMLNIQIEKLNPKYVIFDLRDDELKIGTRGALPMNQFDIVKSKANVDPITMMISRCYGMLLDPESDFNKEYIYKY